MLKQKLTFLRSNMMCVRHLFKPIPLSPQFLSLSSCRKLSSQNQETSPLEVLDEDKNEMLRKESEIEKKRNKSGLYPCDFNRQHDKPPYDDPKIPYHETLQFKRRMYGRYGELSKVNPSLLWPSKVELAEMQEYLAVAQPFTIQDLIKRLEKKKQREMEKRKALEVEVLEKVKRIPIEIIEFKKKVEQKRLKAEELIKKTNKLIMETKKHFDYPIDIRDQKFQLKMAEIKEEERKRIKSEKKVNKMMNLKKFKQETERNKTSDETS